MPNSRFGGDEFAVLVPQVRSRPDLEEIAARLESALRQPVAVADQRLHSSASFGLALYPQDGRNRKELLESADSAMYAAKLGKRV